MIGNAIYISPAITIPTNITGIRITVNRIFKIPHVALIPNKNSFPKIQSRHIKNNMVNILSPLSFLL